LLSCRLFATQGLDTLKTEEFIDRGYSLLAGGLTGNDTFRSTDWLQQLHGTPAPPMGPGGQQVDRGREARAGGSTPSRAGGLSWEPVGMAMGILLWEREREVREQRAAWGARFRVAAPRTETTSALQLAHPATTPRTALVHETCNSRLGCACLFAVQSLAGNNSYTMLDAAPLPDSAVARPQALGEEHRRLSMKLNSMSLDLDTLAGQEL
jgi:hypothetical protein